MMDSRPAGVAASRRPGALVSLELALSRHEWLIPASFFFVFLALALPGISWGAPAFWHPDEVLLRAVKALYGEWDYYEANFNHPFLPQNVMFLIGKAVLALGMTDTEVMIAARAFSAILLGGVVVLVYRTARRMGAAMSISALASLLLLSTSEMVHNAHFAHTDAYVAFFSMRTVFFLVAYNSDDRRGWLYAAFLSAGFALSSKYNSLLLLLAPPLVYLLKAKSTKKSLSYFEPLFIGGVLSLLAFGIGTPRFLFWMSYYLKRAVPAFIYNGSYGYQPGAVRGVIGQYAVLAEGIGLPLLILFALALAWSLSKVVQSWRLRTGAESSRAILLLAILLLDLPILLSYNFAVRFFLPLLPFFAILSALFIGDLVTLAKGRGRTAYVKWIGGALALVVLFSFARTLSVILLFTHDARFAAGEYMQSLPAGTSLEYTFYPPAFDSGRFAREHNYPLYFIKAPGETVPISKRFEYNVGEAGLDERQTDYLVTDSFTADRFNDPYICSTMQVECDFFKQLDSGGSAHYRLLADFRYSPPVFLPQIRVAFVNPGIRIYERVK